MLAQIADTVAQQLKRTLIHTIARYTFAIGSTGFVIWLRYQLHPMLGVECPFSLFYLSVLLTAWVAGLGPAILSIVLGGLAAAYLFVTPASSLLVDNIADLVHLAIYLFVNIVAAFLFFHVQQQRQLAEGRSIENQQLNRSLKLADARKDEFLALLAHELRNPLAPIRTCVSLLERPNLSSQQLTHARGVIQRQVNHLVRMTDDLLDVSRFNQGKMKLQKQNFDLRDAVTDAIEMTDSLIQSRNQRLKVLLPDSPAIFHGDRVRLAQMIANLTGNASKYSPVEGRICVSLDRDQDQWVLSVEDNGIGFPAEACDRILEPFVQMDASRTREYGGLGVGLTITQRLASLHQGNLVAFSGGPGQGSRFRVTLPAPPLDPNAGNSIPGTCDPLPQEISPAAAQASPHFIQPADPGSHDHLRLLLVDDNRDAIDLLKEMFDDSEIDTQIAYDGFEALDRFTQFSPNVVVVDIGMPCMDGYQLLARIRRLQKSPVRVIALTGWGSEADIQRSQQAGFDLHLVKPVRFETLLAAVQTSQIQTSPSETLETPRAVTAATV